ncbi:hypothetical protein BBJ28_00003508 [Nothophytophthora sp. Chile5]|nr:hypothetical protein BBJ28_00003508 [Nothophytophthora sp. Chile5]
MVEMVNSEKIQPVEVEELLEEVDGASTGSSSGSEVDDLFTPPVTLAGETDALYESVRLLLLDPARLPGSVTSSLSAMEAQSTQASAPTVLVEDVAELLSASYPMVATHSTVTELDTKNVLILDEIDVDPTNEERIQKYVSVSALQHASGSSEHFDGLLVLHNGQVAHLGTAEDVEDYFGLAFEFPCGRSACEFLSGLSKREETPVQTRSGTWFVESFAIFVKSIDRVHLVYGAALDTLTLPCPSEAREEATEASVPVDEVAKASEAVVKEAVASTTDGEPKWLSQFVAYVYLQGEHLRLLSAVELAKFARSFCEERLMSYDPSLFQSEAAWEVSKLLAVNYPLLAVHRLVGRLVEKNVLILEEISAPVDDGSQLQKYVVASMLQQTPAQHQTFDDLLVLRDGQVVYHGPGSVVEDYFALGFEFPSGRQASEFLLSLETQQSACSGSRTNSQGCCLVEAFAVFLQFVEHVSMVYGGALSTFQLPRPMRMIEPVVALPTDEIVAAAAVNDEANETTTVSEVATCQSLYESVYRFILGPAGSLEGARTSLSIASVTTFEEIKQPVETNMETKIGTDSSHITEVLTTTLPLLATHSVVNELVGKNVLILNELEVDPNNEERLLKYVTASGLRDTGSASESFDDLVVLKSGCFVYHGTAEDIEEYFAPEVKFPVDCSANEFLWRIFEHETATSVVTHDCTSFTESLVVFLESVDCTRLVHGCTVDTLQLPLTAGEEAIEASVQAVEYVNTVKEITELLAGNYPQLAVHNVVGELDTKSVLILNEIDVNSNAEQHILKYITVSALQHASSSSEFFDDLLVLDNGRLVYHGVEEDIGDYFSLAFEFPCGSTACEFFSSLLKRETGSTNRRSGAWLVESLAVFVKSIARIDLVYGAALDTLTLPRSCETESDTGAVSTRDLKPGKKSETTIVAKKTTRSIFGNQEWFPQFAAVYLGGKSLYSLPAAELSGLATAFCQERLTTYNPSLFRSEVAWEVAKLLAMRYPVLAAQQVAHDLVEKTVLILEEVFVERSSGSQLTKYVVASMIQHTSDQSETFDALLIVRDGQLAYHGSGLDVEEYFALGFEFPSGRQASEFLLDLGRSADGATASGLVETFAAFLQFTDRVMLVDNDSLLAAKSSSKGFGIETILNWKESDAAEVSSAVAVESMKAASLETLYESVYQFVRGPAALRGQCPASLYESVHAFVLRPANETT